MAGTDFQEISPILNSSSRRQHSTVLGCTITGARFHVRNLLADSTNSTRSRPVSAERSTCHFSTVSCCRRRMFSSTSSGSLRVRSMTALRTRPWLSGFVHRRNRYLADWQTESMQFRTKENGGKLIACLSRSSCRPRFYRKTRLLVTILDGWEYSARTGALPGPKVVSIEIVHHNSGCSTNPLSGTANGAGPSKATVIG